MNKITVWYSIQFGGDGSASLRWFLLRSDADNDQKEQNEDGEGWAEPCYGSVETYEGSDIHIKAKLNR